jgi:predicted Zn-dependent peptidase
MDPKFHNYTLDNGLKVLLIPIKDIKTVATSLTFDIGYLEEIKENDGLAHLAEHIVSRFITNHTSVKKLKSAGNFVYTNAHTNHFKTDYHIHSSKKFLPNLLDAYLKLYDFNHTDRNIFYKELGAVIVELKQIISNKDKYIFYKNMPELIFGSKHILVNDPIPEIKNLVKKTECELVGFVRKFYTPSNSVLTIVGNIDISQTFKMIKEKYGTINNGIRRNNRLLKMPSSKSPHYNFEASKTSKLNNLYLTFTCNTINKSKDMAIIHVLKKILVELNDSSILFERLRSKLGVIYSPKIIKYINNHYGLFIINYNIETKNYDKGFTELITILNELKSDKVDENLFNLAKDKILFEISQNKYNYTPQDYLKYSDYVLNGRELISPLNFYNKYTKHLTLNDIRKWCKTVFIKNNSYLCIVGGKDLFKTSSIKELKKLG